MMPAPAKNLSTRDRWLVYLVLAALPGMNVTAWFGFWWSMLFELVIWLPQQRLFDALHLAETLPFQDVR